jgi:hypothetical protein
MPRDHTDRAQHVLSHRAALGHDGIVFNIFSNTVHASSLSRPAHLLGAAVTALATICVAGCTRHAVPATRHPSPVAAPVSRAPAEPAIEAPAPAAALAGELMHAIFGADYRAADGAALAHIDDGPDAGYWRMTLYAARMLPDGRTAVVVNGAPSDENDADIPAHAAQGMLGVYTLRRTGGTWHVLARHPDVRTMGSSGTIGVVKWIDLGAGKPGIVVSSGGTWFGSTIAGAAIFDLDRGMRSLGGFTESSSNAGACMPETKDCWEVDAVIATVAGPRPEGYRDIVVDFTGRHFRVTEAADGNRNEHPTRTVRQTARYRFNGKQYVLVAGANPVPGIDN